MSEMPDDEVEIPLYIRRNARPLGVELVQMLETSLCATEIDVLRRLKTQPEPTRYHHLHFYFSTLTPTWFDGIIEMLEQKGFITRERPNVGSALLSNTQAGTAALFLIDQEKSPKFPASRKAQAYLLRRAAEKEAIRGPAHCPVDT